MNITPSTEQLALFNSRPAGRPVVLFHEYSLPEGGETAEVRSELAGLAERHAGTLLWAAAEEQNLVGVLPGFQQAAQFSFRARRDALAFIADSGHERIAGRCAAFRVSVLTPSPRGLGLVTNILAKVLPWVPFDNAIDSGEEPGIGTSSVMPTAAALAEFKAHPGQDYPVVMINWFKYRDRTAYMRYGKVALLCTHSTGAKLLCASRYCQVLIGNDGKAAPEHWDEFALMQYPNRAAFAGMTALQRYRRALPHREAGLAELGQGLTVTRPLPQFVWNR